MKRPLSLCLSLSLSSLATAEILNVPGSYETIQGGIDAASTGDIVLVAPGAYFEVIDFLGKAITVRSEAGPEETSIKAPTATAASTIWCATLFSWILKCLQLRKTCGRAYMPTTTHGEVSWRRQPAHRPHLVAAAHLSTPTFGGLA